MISMTNYRPIELLTFFKYSRSYAQ